MTGERMFEIMGNLSDKTVSESAENTNKRPRSAVKWVPLAAALALAVGIGAGFWANKPGNGGIGPTPGGGNSEGAVPGEDNGMWSCSVAVHPAGARDEDVAEAVVIPMGTDGRGVKDLGDYIPEEMPGGLFVARCSQYRTAMVDGTVYRMLRVEYTDGGTMPAPGGEAEQYAVTFSLSIWSFRPDTDDPIYSPAEVTAELLAENPGTVHLDYGKVYVSLHPGGQSPEELLEILRAIGKGDATAPSSPLISDAVTGVRVTHILAGQETDRSVEGDDLEALRAWANGLSYEKREFEEGHTPGDAEGQEAYLFELTSGDDSGFDYVICGPDDCYLLIGDTWYAVSNPSDPY